MKMSKQNFFDDAKRVIADRATKKDEFVALMDSIAEEAWAVVTLAEELQMRDFYGIGRQPMEIMDEQVKKLVAVGKKLREHF
jgi:hypothetical protein